MGDWALGEIGKKVRSPRRMLLRGVRKSAQVVHDDLNRAADGVPCQIREIRVSAQCLDPESRAPLLSRWGKLLFSIFRVTST